MATEPDPPQPQPVTNPPPRSRDHDQRGKQLIEACFVELIQWLRPSFLEHFRFDRPEWLRQEIFVNPPAGDRVHIDLVAKVPAVKSLPHHRLPSRKVRHALFHTEIENSKTMIHFRPRVASYSMDLEHRHDLPVFSQALLLRVGQQGLGEDEHSTAYFGSEIRRTKWVYAGLPALDGLKYIEGDNLLPLALSPLMRIEPLSRMEACALALQKIYESEVSPQKRFLLGECVQAYGQLDLRRWERFMKSLTSPSRYSGADAMVSLIFKEGRIEGRLEGRLEGRHETFLDMLRARFSTISPEVERQVRSLSEADVRKLIPSVFSVSALEELNLPQSQSGSRFGDAVANGGEV